MVPWGMLILAGCFSVAWGLIDNEDVVSRVLESPLGRRLMHDTDRLLLSKTCAVVGAMNSRGTILLLGSSMAAVVGLLLAYRPRPIGTAAMVAVAWTLAFRFYVSEILPQLEPIREQQTMAALARESSPPQSTLYYYGREDQQLMFYLGPNSKWLPDRNALLPIITQPGPVYVLMEKDRYMMRRTDRSDLTLIPLAENTGNIWGVHESPTVLVANEAGWRLVQSRGEGMQRSAN